VTEQTEHTTTQPRGWRRIFRGKFLVISIVFHLLIIVGATYLVVQTFAPRKKTFQAPPTAPQNAAVEHQVQMAKKQKTMSAPAPAKRVTTTGLAKVVLPEMPDMPSTEPVKAAAITTPGMGLGTGVGTGSGTPGGGVPYFGLRNVKGLEGTFYDLKQTPDRKLSPVQDLPRKPWHIDPLYNEAVQRFVRSGFSASSLAKFFKGPNPIYAQQIFIPGIPADDGPKAFGLEKEVLPSRWIVVYRGKVRAPFDGSFRFVGYADDVLVVRFNHNIVLDGSFAPITGKEKKFYKYKVDQRKDRKGGTYAFEGMAQGSSIIVKKGQIYDLEIVIGEAPGGHFYAQLLMEQIGEKYQKDAEGNPILPIFRVADVPPPDVSKSLGSVPVASGGPIWQAITE
jgi:hypothetical protein